MSLSFLTLPKQPGLTLWYSVFLYLITQQYSDIIGSIRRGLVNPGTKLSMLIEYRKWEIGGLGWGLRTRHLVFVPLFLWGGNHTASRRPAGVYTHI